MITFSIATRTDNGDLPLPVRAPYRYRTDSGRGGHLVNDTRLMAQAIPDDHFYPAAVYAYEAQREIITYRVSSTRLVEDAQVVNETRLINLFIPRSAEYPSLLVGSSNRIRQALNALEEYTRTQAPSSSASWQVVEFDLIKIVEELRDDQWFRSFQRQGNIRGGKLFGEGIELDQILALVESDSQPDEVGITLQVSRAQLMIRILQRGRIQFYNFSDIHLWDRKHPLFGDPWPLINETVDFLQRYVK